MNKKGFTLIELVVAIAVMGVIMVIALPAINTFTGDNDMKKFIAYEKTLKSAAKLYTDAYDEDLFGYKNTGCQTITYNDLKNKKLIEDISLKGVTCEPANTYVFVYKDKNSNHAYYSSLKCKKNGAVVYNNSERTVSNCKIEDGNGPTVQLINEQSITNPIDNPYNNGKIYGLTQRAPVIKIVISDSGVGLKPGFQNLKYQWYKQVPGGTVQAVTGSNSSGNVPSINPSEYYTGNITSHVPVPQSDIFAAGKDTFYTVKINGTVVDINNNTNHINMQPQYNDGPNPPATDTAYDVEKHSKCPTITFKQANGSTASTSAWYNTSKNKITMTIQPVTGISKFNADKYRMFYNFKAKSSDSFDANSAFSNYDLSIPINTNTTKAVGAGFNGKLVWRTEFYKKNSSVRHDCGRTGTYHFDHNNPKISVSITGDTGKAEDGGTGYKNSISFKVSCSDQTSSPHLVFDNKNKGTSFTQKYTDRVKSKTFSVKCLDQAGNQDKYSYTFRIIKKEASCKHCGVKTYNTCRDKSFGCELHKRSSVCTCNTWASCRTPACKCQTYKTRTETEYYTCRYSINGGNYSCNRSGYSGCQKKFRAQAGSKTTNCINCTCSRTKTVKTNKCKTWKKCQHKDCGCALYNRCNAAPCERYNAKAAHPCSCKVGKTCWF